MNKLNLLKTFLVLLAFTMVFTACDDDDDNSLGSVIATVDATSYSDWVYYSLSDEAIVEITDPATSLDWDIALMRNHVRTNSGSSGLGEGGAYDIGVVDFQSVTEVNNTGYAVDDSIQAFDFAIMEYVSVAASSVLEEWGTFDNESPPVLTVNNNVYGLKTANGNYAKIIFLSYSTVDGTGHVSFEYVYQPDGTLVF